MQKQIDYLNKEISEFVENWEMGYGNTLTIDLDYLNLDGDPVLAAEELNVILADFEDLYAPQIEGWTLTLEIPYHFLEDCHKRRTRIWEHESNLQKQEYYSGVL